MALTIDNPKVEELARELAIQTGESVEEAVATAIRNAIRERMSREPRPDRESAHAAIREFQDYLMKLPVLDSRAADEVLGYDEFGLPH